MSFKHQATLPQGQLHSWLETQALLLRRSSGERGGLHMNGTCVHVCAACALKKVKGRVHVHLYQVAVACVGSMSIRRVLCGPYRHAKLTPFGKNLTELAAGLLPKRRWQLATHH